MYEQLPGSLRYIEIVLKKLINGGKCLIIQIIRHIIPKNFLYKNFAQIYRQLIDQTADSQRTVCNSTLLCVENLSYIQCHFCFFIGFGHVLQLLYHCAERNLYIQHGLRIHHCHYGIRHFHQGVTGIICLQRFDQNDAALIYCSNVIACMTGEHSPKKFHNDSVLLQISFHQKNRPRYRRLYMKLLRPVINIYQKQVVKQQILEEIIPVKSLFVCNNKILQLTHCYLAYHIDIFTGPFCDQDIQKFSLVHDLQQVMNTNHLAVCGRIGKPTDQFRRYIKLRRSRCNRRTHQIVYAQIHLCNGLQFIYTDLNCLT